MVDSEKFRVIVFQYRAKNDNSEFSLPSMIPYVKVKFRVIVLGIGQKTMTWNSEFSLPSMIPHDIKNSELSFFMCRAKSDNLELGIQLRTNSEWPGRNSVNEPLLKLCLILYCFEFNHHSNKLLTDSLKSIGPAEVRNETEAVSLPQVTTYFLFTF